MEIEDEPGAAAPGHDRHDPGHVAVGHRQPLRLAQAGAQRRARSSPTAARSWPTSTSAPVDLDVLFNTLDEETRAGLRNVIRGSGDLVRRARPPTPPRAPSTSRPSCRAPPRLTQRAGARPGGARALRDATARPPCRRSPSAATTWPGSWSTPNTTFRAIADESTSLQRALELLPGTLRKANTTFVNLRATLDDLEQLVDESKPATRDLAPFFRRAAPAGGRRAAHDRRPARADPPARREQRPDRADGQAAAAGAAHRHASSRARSARSTAPSRWSSTRAATRPTWPAGSPSSARSPATTTPTATTPACSRCSARPSATPTARSRRCRPPERLAGLRARHPAPLPRRRGAAAARRLGAALGARLRHRRHPARPMRRLVYIACSWRSCPWIVIGIVREATDDDTKDALLRARDLRQRLRRSWPART